MKNESSQKIYTPFDTGHYRFNAGLRSLVDESTVFEFDDRFDHYIDIKKAVANTLRDEHIGKVDDVAPQIVAANDCIVRALNCDLPDAPPFEAFCSLAMNVQEDLAIMHVPEKGVDRLVATHVCMPSGWSPHEVLGQSFLKIHGVIPEFEAVNRAAPAMMHALTRDGVKERFVWGINFSAQLNRGLGTGWVPFDSGNPELFVRVERQCMIGLPEADAFLFTIRTYIYDAMEFSPALRAKLRDALESWTPAMREYKGVTDEIDPVIAWLESGL